MPQAASQTPPPPDLDPVDKFVAIVLAKGFTTQQAIERAQRVAEAERQRLDHVLNRLGLITDENFAQAWSEALGLPIAEEGEYPDEPVLANLLKPAFLRNSSAVPLRSDNESVTIACGNPLDLATPTAIRKRSGLDVRQFIGKPGDIARALDRLYGIEKSVDQSAAKPKDHGLAFDVERLRDLASDAPVIRFVQGLIEAGIEAGASDIHLSLGRSGPRLQLRVDGLLRDIAHPPAEIYGAVLSRIKILAGLDIAEQRLPQDGSLRAVYGGREIDLRIATMPHVYGEGAVMRILDQSAVQLDFDALGVSPRFIEQLISVLALPSGLVLMTGPTGSGKTTTLYAALKATRRVDRNVITIEDPVEHQLDGIKQVSINHKIQFDFAKALRAVLRQDPDVIMVGEIRDQETAQVAARAALTGHLVIATVHTHSALAALPRLIDMGVEPYLVASTVRAVMAQRLVRRLCDSCKEVRTTRSVAPQRHGVPAETYHPTGCETCKGSGFRGRTALCEFIPVSDSLSRLVIDQADTATLTEHAASEGAHFLLDDAWSRVADGTTSIAEVERVVGLD